MSAFVLGVGTPFDQLEALLQFPDAPPTQHVLPEGQVNVSGPAATEAKGWDKRDTARPVQLPLRCGKVGPLAALAFTLGDAKLLLKVVT
jgi:hypothetical protein